MIAPFNIFCQQEVNWTYNQFPKAQQGTCDRGARKSYILVGDSITNIYPVRAIWPAQLKQVHDKNELHIPAYNLLKLIV